MQPREEPIEAIPSLLSPGVDPRLAEGLGVASPAGQREIRRRDGEIHPGRPILGTSRDDHQFRVEQATAQRNGPGDIAELTGDAASHRGVVEDRAVRLCQLPMQSGVSRGGSRGLDAENRWQRLLFEELPVEVERGEHGTFAMREVARRPLDALADRAQAAQVPSSSSCRVMLDSGRR